MMAVHNIYKIIYYLTSFLAIMPKIVRIVLIKIFFLTRSIPQEFTPCALMYIKPSVLTKIIYLADDEMEKVVEPDYSLIEKNQKRLTFFYSTTDGWTPITYYERLKSRLPNVVAHLTSELDHSFVLKHSNEMAVKLAEWIQQNRT